MYTRGNPVHSGDSPQAVYEQLWFLDRRKRLRNRAIMAAVGLVAGAVLVALWFGLVLAALVALADTIYHWRQHAATRVWRHGQRGERRTARLLRFALARKRHFVLSGRKIPGYGPVDHLVIGPSGVTVIADRAWSPDTEITTHRKKLFIDDCNATELTRELRQAAEAVATFLSGRSGVDVTATALLVVRGANMERAIVRADGITLLREHRLPRWFRRPTQYAPEEVTAIAGVAGSLTATPIGRW